MTQSCKIMIYRSIEMWETATKKDKKEYIAGMKRTLAAFNQEYYNCSDWYRDRHNGIRVFLRIFDK